MRISRDKLEEGGLDHQKMLDNLDLLILTYLLIVTRESYFNIFSPRLVSKTWQASDVPLYKLWRWILWRGRRKGSPPPTVSLHSWTVHCHSLSTCRCFTVRRVLSFDIPTSLQAILSEGFSWPSRSHLDIHSSPQLPSPNCNSHCGNCRLKKTLLQGGHQLLPFLVFTPA